MLTRRNADIGPLYAELTARDVPVEIVGLGGLLSLPEVMDVTATLRVLEDVTANPDLVRLLTGPRWRVGARDLALLGRRARELAQVDGRIVAEVDVDDVLRDLEGAVADVDPTEMISLLDAVESPGELPYSSAALARFAQLAAELGALRRHTGEPVLDLCRRVVATLGLEVELMATPELDRTNRRDQLGAFFDAVAGYVDVDGDASLAGLLAYLQAELDTGSGLEQAVPSDREAVKLLTVHRAKGLEWEVVFLPALMKGVFPSDRVTDNWLTNPGVLPADLRGDADSIPQLSETSNAAVQSYKEALKDQQLRAEDRLAYVAATRARRRADRHRPHLAGRPGPAAGPLQLPGRDPGRGRAPGRGAGRGAAAGRVATRWSRPAHRCRGPRRTTRRPGGTAARPRRRSKRRGVARPRPAATSRRPAAGTELLLDGLETTARWDADLERLLAELAAARCRAHRGAPAGHAVGDVPAAAATRPAGTGGRDRPADAGTAVPVGAVRHPVPPVGGALLRRRRWRPGSSVSSSCWTPTTCPTPPTCETTDETGLRELCATFLAGTLRQPGAVRRRGTRHDAGRRHPGPRSDRRRLRPASRATRAPTASTVRLPGGRLEDRPGGRDRPAAARDLPSGLGRGVPGPTGTGGRGVLPGGHRLRGPTRRDFPVGPRSLR